MRKGRRLRRESTESEKRWVIVKLDELGMEKVGPKVKVCQVH